MSKAGARLIESALQALDIAEGSADPQTFYVHKPEPVDVKAIRRKVGMTQREFSRAYGVPLETLRGWEQAKRAPDAPTTAYLRAIARIPDAIREALAVDPG